MNPGIQPVHRPAERRRTRRLDIRLPVELRVIRADGELIIRTMTRNVSAGGLYLELENADLAPGERGNAELSIPPADGVSSCPGRAAVPIEIVRIAPLADRPGNPAPRYALAARFLEPLRFSF
jgi:hypothetical protein